MIKRFAFMPRKSGISVEEFREHWRTVHLKHALRITILERYVQAARMAPQHMQHLAAGRLPGAGAVVAARRHQPRAVWAELQLAGR